MFPTCWSRICFHHYTSFSPPRISRLTTLTPVVLLLMALSCTTIHASTATTKTSGESSTVLSVVTPAHSSETTGSNFDTNTPIHSNVLSHVAARTPLLKLEGVELAHFKTINGNRVFLNGAGIREIRFMGMNFKVYVASFYALQHIDTAEAILERFNNYSDSDDEQQQQQQQQDDCLYQMDFTFLRAVGQSKVTQAWSEQLEYSVTHTAYEGYETDRDAFIGMFGPIQTGGTETVQLIGHNTVVYDQGEYKGTIPGRDFQRAFLSVWFGEKAVAADLKAGLLGHVILDEKNVLAVLRAAAAAAEGGNGHHHHHHPIIAPKEEEGSSASATGTTTTTATATATATATMTVVVESPPPPTCDEKQPELCHE